MHDRYIQRCFNLVELVIILTVLLAISCLFLPSIIKFTALGKVTACTDNLKEVSNLLQIYNNEYGGMPPWEDGWANLLATANNQQLGDAQPEGIWACPAQEFVSHDSNTQPGPFWQGTNFGINQHIASKLEDKWGGRFDHFYQAKFQGLRDPSATVAIADAAGGNFFHEPGHAPTVSGLSMTGADYADALGPQPAIGLPYARHVGNQANFLFVDGHTEIRSSWPNFMGGKGTGGYNFWHGDHKVDETANESQ